MWVLQTLQDYRADKIFLGLQPNISADEVCCAILCAVLLKTIILRVWFFWGKEPIFKKKNNTAENLVSGKACF